MISQYLARYSGTDYSSLLYPQISPHRQTFKSLGSYISYYLFIQEVFIVLGNVQRKALDIMVINIIMVRDPLDSLLGDTGK